MSLKKKERKEGGQIEDEDEDHQEQEFKRRKLPQRKAKLPQMSSGGCKVAKINLKKSFWTGKPQAQGTPILPRAETGIKVQVRRISTGKWKTNQSVSTPKPDANNASGVKKPQADLAAFKQSLIEICRVTGRPEPDISCCYRDGLKKATVLVGDEGPVQGTPEVFRVEAQGTAAKIWMEKYQPDWRRLLGPAGSTVSAVGVGEDDSLEMEVEKESNISVVDGEDSSEVDVTTLEADGEIPDEDEVNIFKAASQKMRLEVAAKTSELKGLRSQKEKSVENLQNIASQITAVQRKIEKHGEVLEQYEQEKEADRRRLEALEQEIQERKYRKKELLKIKEKRQEKIGGRLFLLNRRKAEEITLEIQRQSALRQIKTAEQQIADLPNASGYSQEKLQELEDQIAAKKSELECPVCYEEAAPPIYTCVAQHLVCAKCRPSLDACGVCRIPYRQAMLRHRYAEKDHQQLVELRSQRDALQEKLANGDRAQVDREQIQGRAQVHQEERSVVPEEGKVLTEGEVLEEGIDF